MYNSEDAAAAAAAGANDDDVWSVWSVGCTSAQRVRAGLYDDQTQSTSVHMSTRRCRQLPGHSRSTTRSICLSVKHSPTVHKSINT